MQKIFNVIFEPCSREKLRKNLGESFKDSGNQNLIVKVNAEILNRARGNSHFLETLNNANIFVADGVGLVWAVKYLSIPALSVPILRGFQSIFQMTYTGASLIFYPKYCKVIERIPGQEAFNLMLKVAEKENAPVYFFGGEKKVLNLALPKIKKEFPKLAIAGFNEGWDYDNEAVIKDINNSGAKLLIVALGSPKQEYWIRDNLSKLKTVRVAVGEGGTLDFVAGTFRRAPKWMQKSGLEWLWRLFMNKSKTQTGSRVKRVWSAVPVFIYEVVKYKIQNGSTSEEN